MYVHTSIVSKRNERLRQRYETLQVLNQSDRRNNIVPIRTLKTFQRLVEMPLNVKINRCSCVSGTNEVAIAFEIIV